MTLQRPKVGGASERFASQLFGTHVTKTNTVSRSTVSRVCADLKTRYDAWRARRLDDVELDYLFLDASHFTYHVNAAAEPVLAGWGITTDGKPVFVGLDVAAAESTDARADFLTSLGARGLACPLLVISDGAPGLIGAVETTMGAALRQRCLIHRCRNLLAKVPKNAQGQVKADYWKIFDVPEKIEPGPGAETLAQNRIDAFAARWRDSHPAAVRCPADGRANLTVYLRSPPSTRPGSDTPTSSNAPSARPAAGSQSSATSPANTPASAWSGPSPIGHPPAGADSP